jgi:multiple sugar transport system permease protein
MAAIGARAPALARVRTGPDPDRRQAWLFLAPALLVLLGFVAWPLLDGVLTALTSRGVARPGTWIGLANFARLAEDPVFWLSARNSLVLTVGAVTLKFLLGLAGALVLAERFPLRGLVRTLVFLPWAVPGLIAALAWRWLYDEANGVLNLTLVLSGLSSELVYWLSDPAIALWSVMIAMVWHGLPFFIMMYLAGIAAIPAELYEAAAIDGASPIRRFWHVTLPGLKDVIAITLMLSSIWTFNSFHMVFILTNGGPANRTQILPTLAYELAIRQSELGLGAAVMVAVIPIFAVLIVLLTRRMLRERALE